MSAVTPSAVAQVTPVMANPPPFVPSVPLEISLAEFEARFSTDRELLTEDETKVHDVEMDEICPLVASGVGDCIALLAVQVNSETQTMAIYAGYHAPVGTDKEEVLSFLNEFDDQEHDLYLYFIGGIENEDSSKLLQTIKESIAEKFKVNHVVSELFNLLDSTGDTKKTISVCLTSDGKVFWCHGRAN